MAGVTLLVSDYVAVGLYFLAIIGVGFFAMYRTKRNTVDGYFLAERFMTWLPVGASIFSSDVGVEHLIGLTGSGAATGLAMQAYNLNGLFILQALGWIFLPVYIATGVNFYSGAIFIQQSLKWSMYVSVGILLIMTALLTITGGLAAVIYTDTIQSFILIVGSVALAILSFIKVGGYTGLKEKYPLAIANSTRISNSTCGLPNPKAFQMLRSLDDPDMPWLGFLLGATPGSMWYWCTDQIVVQRALAAKTLSHAQGGTILAGYLKIIPMFAMSYPGMISRVLYPDEVACSDPDACFEVCENRRGCSNIAYPRLVLGLMPQGVRGIMLAVMLSALVSSLTSIFNSSSTLFTMDIYRKIRRRAGTNELMIVGRLVVVVMVGIGLALIPMIKEFQGSQLFVYLVTVESHLCPQILTVYALGILWKRTNEQGAISGLVLGSLLGIARLVTVFIYKQPECGEPDTRPAFISKLHFMYFSIILVAFTSLITIAVSLCTKPPAPHMLVRTTYWDCWQDENDDTNEVEKHADNLELNEAMLPPLANNAASSLSDEFTNIEEKEGNEENSNLEKCKLYSCKAIMWICGMSTHDEAISEESVNHKTLHQSPKIKRLLQGLLVSLLITALIIYVYFSIPT